MSDPSAGGYSLSDLGKKNGGGLPSSGGGYSLSSLGGGGGGNLSSNGPIPTFNPTAGAPANAGSAPKGGGGILGWLGRAGSGALHAVEGLPAGLGALGKEAGIGVARTGEQFANGLLNAATIGHAGRANEFHFGGSPDAAGNFNSLQGSTARTAAQNQKDYPALEGIGASYGRNVHELAHPSVLLHDLNQDPTGTTLSFAANVLPFLHGAGAVADLAGADGVAAKIADASHVAGRVAAAPAMPFVHGLGAIADLSGAAPFAARAAEDARSGNPEMRTGKIIASVRNAVENAKAAHELVGLKNEAGAPYADISRENGAMLGLKGVSPDEFAAGILRAQGHAPLLEALSAHPETGPVLDDLLHKMGSSDKTAPSPEAARLAVTPTPNVLAAEAAVRDVNLNREQGNLGGEGLRPGQAPLSVAQTRPEPLPFEVDKQTADARLAAHNADQELAATHAAAGIPSGPRPEGGVPADQANLPALQLAAQRLASPDSMGPSHYNEITNLAADHGLQSPEQIPNYLAHLRQEAGQTPNPGVDALVQGARERANAAHANLAAVEAQAKDSLAAAPAAHRTPLAAVRDTMGALAKEAKNTADPAVQASLAQVAKDIEPLSHLEFWAQQDQQPTHVMQVNTNDINREASGKAPASGGPSSFTTTRAGHVREGIATPYDKAGQMKLLESDLRTKANNDTVKLVDAQHSTTPAAEGVDPALKGLPLMREMKAQGFLPWDPNGGYERALNPDPSTLTADSKFIPRALHVELGRMFSKTDEAHSLPDLALKSAGKGIDKATRVVYRSVLALSPHYLAMRAVGNAFMATINGDIAPGDLAKRAFEAYKMIRAGEEPAIFSQHLNDEVSAVGKFGRATQALPRFLDKAGRTMVFIDQLEKNGGDYAKAARMGNEAMGDYAGMSPGERNVAGRLFPSYSWMKAVSKVVGHLAADHPQAAIWALHMGNIAAQNPQAFKMGPVEQELNPLSIFRAGPALTNPIVKGLIGAGAGFDLGKMKDVSLPEDQKRKFALPAKDLMYYLTNQVPAGKLFHQSPLSGLDQNVARVDTGQLRRGPHNSLLPAFVHSSHTPLGDFGSYWRQFLGNPATPTPNAKGLAAQAKTKLAAVKKANSYEKFLKVEGAKGVR